MNKPTRVVQIIGGGEFGGAERHVFELVSRLEGTAFLPAVVCFYKGRLSSELAAAGVEVEVLPLGPAGFGALARALSRMGPGIVHTHGVRGNFFGRLLANHFNMHPIVTTIHSDLDLDYPDWRQRLVYRLLEQATDPWVTHFIAVSRGLCDKLVARGLAAERITVIPNGVDLSRFAPDPVARERLRAELGLPAGARLAGLVARLHPVKGHPLFLEAAARVLARRQEEGFSDPVGFLVVGDGEPAYRQELEALAGRLGLGDTVRFLGDRDDVPAILAGLDVAVLASQAEGFPLAAIEALAAGVPLVATRVGSLPEIVRDGVDGILVPPGNPQALAAALSRLLSAPDLSRRMGEAARQAAGRFSVEGFVERTSHLYGELLHRDTGGKHP